MKIFEMGLNTWISPGHSHSLFSADNNRIFSPRQTQKKPPKIFCGWFQWHTQMGKFWVLAVKYFMWTPIHRFPPAAAVYYLVQTIT